MITNIGLNLSKCWVPTTHVGLNILLHCGPLCCDGNVKGIQQQYMPLEAPLQYRTVAKWLGCTWAFSPFSWLYSALFRSRLTEEQLWQESSVICDLNYTENEGDGFVWGVFLACGKPWGFWLGWSPWDLDCEYRGWHFLHPDCSASAQTEFNEVRNSPTSLLH